MTTVAPYATANSEPSGEQAAVRGTWERYPSVDLGTQKTEKTGNIKKDA